jgi:hypothetical protein
LLEKCKYQRIAKYLIEKIKQNYPKKTYQSHLLHPSKGFFKHLSFVLKKLDKELNGIMMERRIV